MSETFKAVLEDILLNRGVTKKSLADDLDVSPQALTGLIRTGNPVSSRLADIADVLNLRDDERARLSDSTAKPRT